jgi:hypothetical protein
VVRIAAEDLVAPVAPERDRGFPPDQAGDEIRRHHRRIGDRLVELAYQFGQQVHRRRLRRHFQMLRAEVAGDHTRVRRFVVAAVAGEGNGERLHRLA